MLALYEEKKGARKSRSRGADIGGGQILPVAMLGTVTTGMGAEVVPELVPKRAYIGRVTVVDRVVDAASGTFGVRLEFPNPGNAIPGDLRRK